MGGQGQFGNQAQFGGGFVPNPGQNYKICLAQMWNMVLDSSGNPTAKYKAILWKNNNGMNQKWKFIPDGQGNYSIVSAENGGTL